MSPVPEPGRRSVGDSTTTAPGANATGATAASAPSTTSPIPCSTRAGGRWRTGFWPPSCCACRVRRGALPESWGSIAGRAIAGAGGCGIRPSPTRTDRQLEGTVEADDLYHTAGRKGQAQAGRARRRWGADARGRRKKREPGRGHYDKDRPAIIAWVSRQGAVVIHATRDFTVKTVQKAADLAVQAGQSALYRLGQ